MTTSRFMRSALALAPLLFFTGCPSGPAAVEAPKWDPQQQAAKAMTLYDKDSNGEIDSSELSPGLRAALSGIDTDGNKSISEQELANRIQGFADTQLGLVGVQGMVSLSGRKIPGAQVTFEPEAFLADVLSPATGTIGDDGFYSLQTEGKELGGVQPGLYTVQITKGSGKVDIPARFGEESELGAEVGRVETAENRGSGDFDFKL